MSCSPYYDQCKKYMGRSVGIRTRDGQMHRGVITNVDNSQVYLRPMGNGNLGGFGYGWGWGGGFGGGYGIALGAIAALTLLAFW